MPKYYLLDENKNLVEGFDKEGFLALLQQAIDNGDLEHIDPESAVASKIRSVLNGTTHNIEFVTQAQYNQLEAEGELVPNTYYFITDDTTAEDLDEHIDQNDTRVEDLENRAEALEGRATNLEGRVTDVETKTEDHETRLGNVETIYDRLGLEITISGRTARIYNLYGLYVCEYMNRASIRTQAFLFINNFDTDVETDHFGYYSSDRSIHFFSTDEDDTFTRCYLVLMTGSER